MGSYINADRPKESIVKYNTDLNKVDFGKLTQLNAPSDTEIFLSLAFGTTDPALAMLSGINTIFSIAESYVDDDFYEGAGSGTKPDKANLTDNLEAYEEDLKTSLKTYGNGYCEDTAAAIKYFEDMVSKNEEYNEQVKNINDQIGNLSNELSDLNNEKSQLMSKIENLSDMPNTFATRRENYDIQQDIQDIMQQIEAKEQEIKKKQDELNNLKTGEYKELFVPENDLNTLSTKLSYITNLQRNIDRIKKEESANNVEEKLDETRAFNAAWTKNIKILESNTASENDKRKAAQEIKEAYEALTSPTENQKKLYSTLTQKYSSFFNN